jgi:hypothetical protein
MRDEVGEEDVLEERKELESKHVQRNSRCV